MAIDARKVLTGITKLPSLNNDQNLIIASTLEAQALVTREVGKSPICIRNLLNEFAEGSSQTVTASEELTVPAHDLSSFFKKF
ncbi:hypothetical protein [Pseudomonas monteilii]|uniref:Uncharacterized protein n=1 Tax=Pseudomonas monteilii TaxID=76759 RepID=A0A399M5H9_9PSED|nr:hypothetical protein [Pseudomonas monteilii]RII76575.1 hypothetical protein D0894_15520 [Pseudomonas monteilii]